MSEEMEGRRPAEADEAEDAGSSDDDDVEGHIWLRTGSQGAATPAPGDDEDVEGHAMYRSPTSRGE